ncbi:hypothetical protein COV18_04940 [Candidatus Woesearchaeota archaeon CG10_big_fil_rev_8_21_14_0_10_37_12]|nr:MAG: hypothetical protein COV18_04940 [Candidatus Woesearchaeota archaeon CG10_big_fil_rev_8_21_14_0_10_37_12]
MVALNNNLEKIIGTACTGKGEQDFVRHGLETLGDSLKPYLFRDDGEWAGDKASANAGELVKRMQENYGKVQWFVNPGLRGYLRPGAWLRAAEMGLYGAATASYWMGNPLGGVPSSIAGAGAGQLADIADASRYRKAVKELGIQDHKGLGREISDTLGIDGATAGRAAAGFLSSIALPIGVGMYLKRKGKYQQQAAQAAWYKAFKDSRLQRVDMNDLVMRLPERELIPARYIGGPRIEIPEHSDEFRRWEEERQPVYAMGNGAHVHGRIVPAKVAATPANFAYDAAHYAKHPDVGRTAYSVQPRMQRARSNAGNRAYSGAKV